MSTLRYTYKDDKAKSQQKEITDLSLVSDVELALDDYDIAKSHIHSIYYPIWREGLKMYHLSTADRKKGVKQWQQNAAVGFVRSIIDIFTSTLTENPIVFNVTGMNEEGIRNADNIKRALAYCADASGFQNEVKSALKDGLKTGMFAFEVNVIPESTPKKYTVYKDVDGKKIPEEMEFSEDELDGIPFAKHTSVFNVFPDPYNGNEPQFVVKRMLLSERQFQKQFGAMIESNDNESPLKGMYKFLGQDGNDNGADFIDYDDVIEGVHKERADNVSQRDSWQKVQGGSSSGSSTIGSGTERKGKRKVIEVLYYDRIDRRVLFANKYPVFIGPNMQGFIGIEVQSATDQKRGLDCEGVSYLAGDIDRLITGVVNSMADQVKQVSNPFYVGIKGSFLDEEALDSVGPGDVLWAEDQAGAAALRRFDHGSVTDHGMLNILFDIGTRITGISEYNSGVSAHERTATGALAVSQSSQKRLSPFLQAFVAVVSRISMRFLQIIKQEWSDERFVLVTSQDTSMADQPETDIKQKLSNMDLKGKVLVTLQLDSIFSAINEFQYKKLLEVFREVQSTGLANEDEMIREIFRTQGLSPDKFVPRQAPKMTPPKDGTTPGPVPGIDAAAGFGPADMSTPGQMIGQDIQNMVNPQTTFGG